MNSTQIGDDLEAKIFGLLQSEISQGRFYLKREFCKLFKKKGYYSKDRESDIVFDISIEVFLPGQETYSLLILVECKNYSHSVPVDDAEEFYTKLMQISGANIKGIIASTNSFQRGALQFASSKGIGLLRYYDNNDFKWVLTRSPSSLISNNYALTEWMNAYHGIIDESYCSKYFDCYCCIENNYTNSLMLFFSKLVNANAGKKNRDLLGPAENPIVERHTIVPYRDEADIEELSERVLAAIGYAGGDVPVDEVCKWQAAESKLSVTMAESQQDEHPNRRLLGKITFKPLEIVIFHDANTNPARQKFTLAHEIGHLLLDHGRYMTAEYCEESDFDLERPPDLGIKDIARMEWQANHFASCLLLPRHKFTNDFMHLIERFGISDRGFGLLYLDHQQCNINDYYRITDALKSKYSVSRSVVKIRLKKLGLLNEARERTA